MVSAILHIIAIKIANAELVVIIITNLRRTDPVGWSRAFLNQTIAKPASTTPN